MYLVRPVVMDGDLGVFYLACSVEGGKSVRAQPFTHSELVRYLES
jgi:hypothetical protein